MLPWFLVHRNGSAFIINELRDNNWYTHDKALLKKVGYTPAHKKRN